MKIKGGRNRKEMTIIKVKSRHRVKPAEPTWRGILPLSVLDQISVITHSSVLYFYNKPTQEEWLNPSNNNKIMNTLKNSLSGVLVPYYPLAGRVRYIGDGRFQLECNAMGADLVEVESSMKIADFGDLYFASRQKIPDLLVPMNYYETPIHELPVLAVQITRFACGGLSLGMSLSHIVADGRSAFHFFEDWAMLAVGEPLKEAPSFDRHQLIMLADDVLAIGEPLKEAPSIEDLQLIKVADDVLAVDEPLDFDRRQLMLGDDKLVVGKPLKDTPFFDHPRQMLADDKPNYFRELRSGEANWGKLVAPTFVVLTRKMIQRLKDSVKEHGNQHPYSRFEVIAAHVWRCACKARELKTDEMTTLEVAVSAYERLEPPLTSFFGNAVVEVEASSRIGELLSKPLSYACRLVREAIQNVTNEYILASIKFLQRQKWLSKYQYIDDRGIMEGPAYGDHNVTVVSWLNLANGGLDFGWGKEFQMVPSIVQICDGDIQLSPYGNDGSVVIDACLQPKEKVFKLCKFHHCVNQEFK